MECAVSDVACRTGAGADVTAVQRVLGHASAAITRDVCSGPFADDLDRVAEQLETAALEVREGSTSSVERPRQAVQDVAQLSVRTPISRSPLSLRVSPAPD